MTCHFDNRVISILILNLFSHLIGDVFAQIFLNHYFFHFLALQCCSDIWDNNRKYFQILDNMNVEGVGVNIEGVGVI